ncbi:MAG: glutathione S-transferase family protein [Candidatus Dadabacteria bacterium]|nr:glutathione S-transferase family protein [Candidatus Dadabacteria bacterium]NIS08399.1 glutathione S-transferase family protein [Candidatus Dadabacteria bacterium]NIY21902.1 glutathione S-transferase family protein [Candidatus Dadabacteria bacterium]
MIKLYDHPLSGNCYKVRLLLGHLGLEYNRETVDIFKGEHKTDSYTELNPNQKIPTLDDDGFILWESNAILLYLANKHSPNSYISSDPKRYGLITQWLIFGKTSVDPNLAIARFYKKFLGEGNYKEDDLKRMHAQGGQTLSIMDDHLAKNKFLAGEYSVADMACYPYIMLCPEGGFEIDKYTNVYSWIKRIKSQEGFPNMED